MDDLSSARATITLAIDHVESAIARVRVAQEVDWNSVLASRYRSELYTALQDLARFRNSLEDHRMALL